MIATDLHAETLRIIDLLLATPRGEIVTLNAVSAAIGRDIRLCRHLLYSALHVIERDRGIAFASVRGHGYRMLATDEIVKVGQTARSKIRRAARRGIATMNAAVLGANDISDDMRRKVLREQSALGVLEHLAREKSLPTVPETDTRPLPPATVARQFLASVGATD